MVISHFKDFDFVDSTLAPTLERGATSYKLCLHQRDFPPNASLYDTVAVATESSCRVLVVLSKVSSVIQRDPDCLAQGFVDLDLGCSTILLGQ